MTFKKGDWIVYILSKGVSAPFQLDSDEKDGVVRDRRYPGFHSVPKSQVRHLNKEDIAKILSGIHSQITDLQGSYNYWSAIGERLVLSQPSTGNPVQATEKSSPI